MAVEPASPSHAAGRRAPPTARHPDARLCMTYPHLALLAAEYTNDMRREAEGERLAQEARRAARNAAYASRSSGSVTSARMAELSAIALATSSALMASLAGARRALW